MVKDDIRFDLIDEATVARLQRNGEVKLPTKKLKIPKDKQWNTKMMGSKLLQGILNGDSIDKIAEGLMSVVAMNTASAIRNARTMTTSAECNGRLDSYKNLEEQGVVQKKVWIATPDDRTRESHLEIDGEEVDINEKFSNGCMFPGDADCDDPAEVWMCRCSIRDHIIGFRRADGSVSYIKGDRGETMHDRQIAEEKESRKEAIKEKINNMEDLGSGDIKNLIPYGDKDDLMEASKILNKARKEKNVKYEDEEVLINDLITRQEWIDKNKLISMVDSDIFDNIIIGTATDEDSGIRAIFYKGKYVIIDGNHRANIAILKGQKKIIIRVLRE